MKVYLVMGDVSFEGDEFLGVFSSKELAEKYIIHLKEQDKHKREVFDDYIIVESELDGKLTNRNGDE